MYETFYKTTQVVSQLYYQYIILNYPRNKTAQLSKIYLSP